MWTLAFWKATAERVVLTAVEAALAVLGLDLMPEQWTQLVGVTQLPWTAAASVAGTAAVLSLGKCLVAQLRTTGGPSLTSSEQVATTPASQPEHAVVAADIDDGEPPVPNLAGPAV